MNYAVNFTALNLLMNSNDEQAVLTSVKSGREPLERNETITLRELLGHISSTAGIPTPGKKVLEAASEPIATYSSGNYHMAAFKCGFALVKSEKRWTVVRVDACKGYDYQYDEDYTKPEDTTPHHLDEEYFLDKPWQLILSCTQTRRSRRSKRRWKPCWTSAVFFMTRAKRGFPMSGSTRCSTRWRY